MVSRHSISYLLASVEGYSDLRQFALHRIRQVQLLDEPTAPHTSFDVDHYIASGAFSLRQADTEVE
ncbi:WYL domain-containing protein, partial [Pseudomonas aeruginosa]